MENVMEKAERYFIPKKNTLVFLRKFIGPEPKNRYLKRKTAKTLKYNLLERQWVYFSSS